LGRGPADPFDNAAGQLAYLPFADGERSFARKKEKERLTALRKIDVRKP